MRFSLVVATLGRTQPLGRLLESLTRQTEPDFEVIVVDQNPPGMIADILGAYRSRLSIMHAVSPPGVSRARNLGLRISRGEIIVFPDDDCWYEPDTLRTWGDAYNALPLVGGIMGRCVGPDGETIHGMTHQQSGSINRRNVWRRTNGNGLSFRRRVFQFVPGFDETLGPGAGTPWAACEDADLPIRVLDAGLSLHYQPEIVVRHPNPQFESFSSNDARRRAVGYGRGMGRVLRQRAFDARTVATALIRPLGGALLSLICGQWRRAECYLLSFQGRLQGWWAAPPAPPPAVLAIAVEGCAATAKAAGADCSVAGARI